MMETDNSRMRPIAAVAPLGSGSAAETARDDHLRTRERTRHQYVLAAILFVGGGIGAILPDALHDPPHPPTIYLLPLLAMVSGAITFALAARLPRRALHVVAIVAALEVALTAGLADQVFAVYYTFIAIFAAYVLESRRAIAAHVAFVCLLSFLPLLYAPDDARENLIFALILVPTFVLASGAVAFLRERLAASEARYRDLSEVDPLTGVGNYRKMSLRAPRELRRHRRHGRPLSLVVVDLDDFKRINDTYGHPVGDRVIVALAQLLGTGIEAGEVAARFGGEEFALLMRVASASKARQRLTALLESLPPAYQYEVDGKKGFVAFTFSGGVTAWTAGDTTESIVKRADEALYDAKRRGKRRVETRPQAFLRGLMGG